MGLNFSFCSEPPNITHGLRTHLQHVLTPRWQWLAYCHNETRSETSTLWRECLCPFHHTMFPLTLILTWSSFQLYEAELLLFPLLPVDEDSDSESWNVWSMVPWHNQSLSHLWLSWSPQTVKYCYRACSDDGNIFQECLTCKREDWVWSMKVIWNLW